MPRGRAPQICAHKGIYGHKFKGSHGLEAAQGLLSSPDQTYALGKPDDCSGSVCAGHLLKFAAGKRSLQFRLPEAAVHH